MIEISLTNAADGIRWLTLEPHASEPDRVSLDGAGIAALHRELQAAQQDPQCRAVVIRGRNASFCDGMDLPAALQAASPRRYEDLSSFAECLRLLREMDALTIASVDGRASGGGAGLALACDLVLATRSSSFAFPEVLWGLVPGVIFPVMIDRLGFAVARSLALSAGTIDVGPQGLLDGTTVAARWDRCVDQTCEDAAALERATHAVLKQALRSSPAAIAAMKRYAAGLRPAREGAETGPSAVAFEGAVASARDALPAHGEGLAQRLAAGVAWTNAMLDDPENREQLRALLDGELPAWNRRYRAPRTAKDET